MSESTLINLAAYASLMMGFFIISVNSDGIKGIKLILRIWSSVGFICISVFLFFQVPFFEKDVIDENSAEDTVYQIKGVDLSDNLLACVDMGKSCNCYNNKAVRLNVSLDACKWHVKNSGMNE